MADSVHDKQRIAELEKEREKNRAVYEERKKSIIQEGQGGLKGIDDLFHADDTLAEDTFKRNTIGLVSAEDFKRKRQEMEEAKRLHEEAVAKAKRKERKRKERKRKQQLKSLSFDVEEDGDEDGEAVEDGLVVPAPTKKIRKDPDVATHFLPDREREAEEERLRVQLAEEWMAKQEAIKNEEIEVTYSYWDGSGHRFKIVVTKGTTIGQFLDQCRRNICDQFHELRGVSQVNMLYIKEDLIIPRHLSFYDLIVSKARGKSGPLFRFDVHDNVTLAADRRIERDESHAGKIVTRGWYESNKHVFPASRWEMYDERAIATTSPTKPPS